MRSAIAIIEPQYLTAVGMRTLLEAVLPHADIFVYQSVQQCRSDIEREDGGRPYFVHFFVADTLLWANHDYFRSLPQTVIALSHNKDLDIKDFPAIDVTAAKEQIYEQILHLRTQGHPSKQEDTPLSKREIDVLRLVVQGRLNKEIADTLSISQNTVITHRTHITSKLGIHSVPALTMYAILNGYIAPNEIYQ